MQRRPGDMFNRPSINNCLKRRYECEHVKAGARIAVQLDDPAGIVAICDQCNDVNKRLVLHAHTNIAHVVENPQ